MRIYLHVLTVTVITNVESPDAIERVLDQAGQSADMRIDARTDPENRMRGPSVEISDPPQLYDNHATRAEQLAWAELHDRWRDSWPSVEEFPS